MEGLRPATSRWAARPLAPRNVFPVENIAISPIQGGAACLPNHRITASGGRSGRDLSCVVLLMGGKNSGSTGGILQRQSGFGEGNTLRGMRGYGSVVEAGVACASGAAELLS